MSAVTKGPLMHWLLKLMMEMVCNGSCDGVMVMHSIMNEEVRPRASLFVSRHIRELQNGFFPKFK